MQRTFPKKPVLVSAKDVMNLTIWNTPRKMDQARRKKQLFIERKNGKIFYDINKVSSTFLKARSLNLSQEDLHRLVDQIVDYINENPRIIGLFKQIKMKLM